MAGYGTCVPGAGGPPSSLKLALVQVLALRGCCCRAAARPEPGYWALSANRSCRIVAAVPATNVPASTT